MRARALLVLALVAAVAGACRGREKPTATENPVPAAATATAPPVTNVEGEDPEPPDAQARAEAVLSAPFNTDKTTKLVMHITTLVAQTSSISGFGSTLAANAEKIEDKLSRLGATVTDTEVVIRLPGAILFDFDSANIRPDADRALTDVAQVIQSYAKRPVRVEGHTDAIASNEYNQALSEKRAASVVTWLSAHGVERARLASAGRGETQPVASNDTAEGRQANRRVEVVIARK
jgi:outer membrane protein OmpA-like peptidoglycan-associated protein